MKDYCDDINQIPKNLCGTCFDEISLCLFCQNKIDEYKKNPFCIWEQLPDKCKFAGWIFSKREEIKQKIRKKKEKILSLQVKLDNSNGMKKKRIIKEIEKYKKEIFTYKEYGSESW